MSLWSIIFIIIVLVLNDFFPALDDAANNNNSSSSSDFLKWPTTIFFYYYYFPCGGATRKINRALTKQNSSGFCPAEAWRRRAFPSTGLCGGGFSLLLHVIIFIFLILLFSVNRFRRAFFIRSRRSTLFANSVYGRALYNIHTRVYIIITYYFYTPYYTHIYYIL